MKIQVTADVHYRITSGVSVAYRPGVHTVPKAVGDALVKRGFAEVVRKTPRPEKERNHGNG